MKLIDILVTVLCSVFLLICVLITILVIKYRKNKKNRIVSSNNANTKSENQKQFDEMLERMAKQGRQQEEEQEEDYLFTSNNDARYKELEEKVMYGTLTDSEMLEISKLAQKKQKYEVVVNLFKELFRKKSNITLDNAILASETNDNGKLDGVKLQNLDDLLERRTGRKKEDYYGLYKPLYNIAKKEVLKEQSNSVLGGFIKFIKKVKKKNKQTIKSKNIKSKNIKSKNIKSKKTNKK